MLADTSRIASSARILVVVLALGMLATATSAMATSTKEELDAAKRTYARLTDEIEEEESRLASLRSQAYALAGRIEEAEGRLEKTLDDLKETQEEIAAAKERLAALQEALAERARAAYIQGPGNDLEFLLGATSLSDLADRVQFVDALSQADLDLSTEVQNLSNKLADRAVRLEELSDAREAAIADLASQQDELFGKLREQQEITDSIEQKVAQAKALVATLSKKYQEELAAIAAAAAAAAAANGSTATTSGGGAGAIGGILFQCPVDQPRVVYDGFGAPRYGGGYHPHAGNDIIAPMGTPIRAPFPGTARSSYNTLGGNAVYVYGAKGYVYNAHLSRYSSKSNGPVQTGDIIGYVGATGDTSTPHNHFEWHPSPMPGSWPTSPYGYTTVGGAVNPWPVLQSVC